MPTPSAAAAIDADIAKSQQAAAALASRRKELQRTITENLGNGADKPARDAAAELHQLNDEIAFEEQRGRALIERRAAIEAEEKRKARAEKWAEIEALIDKRAATAARIDKAIGIIGTGVVDIRGLSRDIDKALAALSLDSGFVGDDIEPGVIYSLIAAGIPYPNGQDARLTNNKLTDRAARTHAGIAALRLRSEGQERKAA